MRKLLLTVGFATISLFFAHTAVQACGDKILALSRGVRFQRAYAAARPASILIYVAGKSNGITSERPRLQSTLKQAGHKLEVAEDATRLNQLLQSGKFDLVLADFSDAVVLTRQAQSSPSRPTVLPVMFKPTKSELTAAEKQYSIVLKAPGKAGEYLTAIDEAMKVRAHAAHS